MSNSLQPHGLQHTRLICPSPTLRAYSSSCPSRWCHPTISSSGIPFSSCLHSFPASGSFKMSQFFMSGGQIIGVSASTSVFPKNNLSSGQISFRMDWLDILAVQGTVKSLLQHHSSKASILRCSAFFIVQLSHPYVTTGWSIFSGKKILRLAVLYLLVKYPGWNVKSVNWHSGWGLEPEKKKIQMRNIDVKVVAFEVLTRPAGRFFTIWATREAQEDWNR